MAGAAATKGQQNVTRTRPYTGWDLMPVTRGGGLGGTPKSDETWTLSLSFSLAHNTDVMWHLVWHQGRGPCCSWWPPPPPPHLLCSPHTRQTYLLPVWEYQLTLSPPALHQGLLKVVFEVASTRCPPLPTYTPGCKTTWVNLHQPPLQPPSKLWSFCAERSHAQGHGWVDGWIGGGLT